ncbi:MAG: hypothetical protein AB2L12_04455 [Smithellaceae bacterium]
MNTKRTIMLLKLPQDSKLRKPIETMQKSGLRAAAIVQDLLTIARGVAITKEPSNCCYINHKPLHRQTIKRI